MISIAPLSGDQVRHCSTVCSYLLIVDGAWWRHGTALENLVGDVTDRTVTPNDATSLVDAVNSIL
jgi:hypothetical protein